MLCLYLFRMRIYYRIGGLEKNCFLCSKFALIYYRIGGLETGSGKTYKAVYIYYRIGGLEIFCAAFILSICHLLPYRWFRKRG